MLRLIVLLLALMNGAYFAWSHGWLKDLGWAPDTSSEPQRLTQQIKPEALHLLSAAEVQQLEATLVPGLRASECLEAGLFSEAQGNVLRGLLASNPGLGQGSLNAAAEPARWIVYMGEYASPEELAKKRAQLAFLKLPFEPLTNPALEYGLSLGHFETQAGANSALEAMAKRGLKTAHVVLERAEIRGFTLQLKTAQGTTQAQLDGLKPALAGKSLSPCRTGPQP
jgi:hypothetical protein